MREEAVQKLRSSYEGLVDKKKPKFFFGSTVYSAEEIMAVVDAQPDLDPAIIRIFIRLFLKK